jgi:hypothetical protein
MNGSGGISATGSTFDVNDDGSGTTFQGETLSNTNASTISAPDTYGRVLITLNPTDSTDFLQFNFAGYIVDTAHIRLVEEEPSTSTFNGITGGVALGQGASTGTFNTASVSGSSFVLGAIGADTTGAYQVSGVLTTNTDGTTVSGTLNYNDLTGTTTQAPIPFTGTYTVDSFGRVTLSNLTDNATFTYTAELYLAGAEPEQTIISMDTNDVFAGISWQQTSNALTASSFSGTYALDATGADSTNEFELDAVGPVTADGVGTIVGTVDLNWILNTIPTPPLNVNGNFASSANGIFTGTITGLDVTTSSNQDAFTYYMADPTKVFAIETDPNQLTLGFFRLEQ